MKRNKKAPKNQGHSKGSVFLVDWLIGGLFYQLISKLVYQ